MAERLIPKGMFDVPDIPKYIPRRLKPYIFILFVIIIQFSGGIYLASTSDMVGAKALMREDILMAGYAMLVGMSINFAVMFRMKFRFSCRNVLLGSCLVLLASNIICATTESVPLLVCTCFVAGWFRMQATFACNSTIQLWLTPTRDMSVFFCYVYIVVDGVLQLNGIAAVYSTFFLQWEFMQSLMIGLLVLMIVMILVLFKPVRTPMFIPLLGIDWIGAALWSVFMLCFTFVCVYGNFYDWWDAEEIRGVTLLGLACLGTNLWRATFLHHPYISFRAMTNRNVVRAVIIYLVFFTLIATEHVFEHAYVVNILGYDDTNLIDLNWYVFSGVAVGCLFTYLTFALGKWRYKTMIAIGFAMAAAYLAIFYFRIDYGVEKEALSIPLFCRGCATVIVSIVMLTSILQSGLPFMVFPQALTINGFASAVVGATIGPAIVGEWLNHVMAKNVSLLSAGHSDFNTSIMNIPFEKIYGMVQTQALVVSMKEIYGWLLIDALVFLFIILVSDGPVRPWAISPKWSTVRRGVKHLVRAVKRAESEE